MTKCMSRHRTRRSGYVVGFGLATSVLWSTGPLLAQDVGADLRVGPLHRISTILLDDGASAILALPRSAAVLSNDWIAIADASDQDIKVYGADGRRVGTIGRHGAGPGEFGSLRSISVLGDSVVGYDFTRPGATVFAADGSSGRIITSRDPPFDARVVDDSLLLHIAHPGQSRPLLGIGTLDGQLQRDFLDPAWLDEYRLLRAHTAVFADARDGFIHAAVFGSDSLYSFDYRGRRLAARRLPGLGSIVVRWEHANQRLQSPDGTWFHHGMVGVMGVLALPRGDVLVTVAKYNTRTGTDLIAGCQVILLRRSDPGDDLTAFDFPGQPLAIDRNGELVALGYHDYTAGTYRLDRWRIAADP